jgi:hypothetical protein
MDKQLAISPPISSSDQNKSALLALLPDAIAQAVALILADKDRELASLAMEYRLELAELKATIAEERMKAHARIADLKDGKDGAPGRDGEKGETGAKGAPGQAGEKGAPGKDGIGFDSWAVEYNDEREITFVVGALEHQKRHKIRLPIPIYRGIYRPGEIFFRGDCVTYDNSTWIATKDTKEPPERSRDWQMCMRRASK